MLIVGKERIQERDLERFICGEETLTGAQQKAIIQQFHKKIVKKRLNDPFDAKTKQIMQDLGFAQDENGWIVEKGAALASNANRAIVAENELAAAKSELDKITKHRDQLITQLDQANAKADQLAAKAQQAKELSNIK